MIDLVDGCGVPFSKYREHLPKSCHDFPDPERVKEPKLLERLHREWRYCMGCWRRRLASGRLELHHIVGGTKGRSDEACNLMMLCSDRCHPNVNTEAMPLGLLLVLRWYAERETTDWVRLAILRRSFLPDLDFPE